MSTLPVVTDFLVSRSDLRTCRFAEAPAPALAPDQALLRIDCFALTANNITYAVLGDALSYWAYFPAPDGWGRIPVWGFAEVVASRHAAVAAGDRFFGYYPMSSHVVLSPGEVTDIVLVDAAPHRPAQPAVYNRYPRSAPGLDTRAQHEQALLRGQFMTSFLIADYLADEQHFGATTVILTSASSKTALGTAQLLKAAGQVRVVGVTSPSRADFVRDLGCYDDVVTYDRIDELPADAPAVLVDLAGDPAVRRAVYARLGDRLRHACAVGSTHTPSTGHIAVADPDLPGPPPALFHAGARLDKRGRDWGPAGLQERVAAAVQPLTAAAARWLRIVESRGPAAVEAAYRAVLEGTAAPDEGHILSL